MGANQTSGMLANAGQDNNGHRGIHVVNCPTSTNNAQDPRNMIVLPSRVPPILTIDGFKIDPNRHKQQLEQQLWVNFVNTISDYVKSRTDLIGERQKQLKQKIVHVDHHVQNFTDCYVNDRHKALTKMNDDCKQTEELNKILHKCTVQSELCVDMLNKLNFLLPEQHKLENLET